MDSNFGSWGRQLTGGGRANAKRKAKRMNECGIRSVYRPDWFKTNTAARRNRISFQQRLRSGGNKPSSRNRAEPKPYQETRRRSLDAKKKKKSSSTTVISMTRLRCITATFRKTKMVAQSSGTENASGSKYHSFDTTVAPVSGRVDETNLGIVGIKLNSLSETLENSLDGAARQSGFNRGNGTT